MSKSLLDLLNKTRGDIASKRGNNIDLTRLKDGNNYLRIFPNKDDPNGVFFQTFGMHYVKHQNEEGKDVTTAYICEQHTHGHACQLCEMVMEGRARFKGNKAMEERINSMRATPRYLVNGVLSAREDFADAEKCQLIELPSIVINKGRYKTAFNKLAKNAFNEKTGCRMLEAFKRNMMLMNLIDTKFPPSEIESIKGARDMSAFEQMCYELNFRSFLEDLEVFVLPFERYC
ncbi:hypothetical protein D9K09_20270 [Escherichia coli]|nr:hypothetical protein [Escherichia coli]